MHGPMKTGLKEVGEAQDDEPESTLPSFEKSKEIKLSVPKGSGAYETKALLDCALRELDITPRTSGRGTRCSSTEGLSVFRTARQASKTSGPPTRSESSTG